MTTSIRDEASARGTIGPAAYRMMLAVFGWEVKRFPRLAAQTPAEDFLNSFFEQKGAGYVVALVAESDDAAATRLTHAWVKNWLVDQDRKLPMGALRNRLEKRLQRSELFRVSEVAHYWYLTEDADLDKTVSTDDLRSAAAAVEVELQVSASGQVQLGRSGQLESLLRELLLLAGRLHIGQMASICAERFPSLVAVGDAMNHLKEAKWEENEDTADDLVANTAAKLDSETVAMEIYTALSEEEHTILRNAGDAESLSTTLGVGRSTAYGLIKKTRARVIELAGSASRSDEVRGALIDLLMGETSNVPS
ncbi:hypothetical protein [Luethyella okanaganae]|uniref:Uncharacterized protein n=1 Tax=Luethyella okanaganae TaxID=69372 RepID=A0ABW1VGA3_9MICO